MKKRSSAQTPSAADWTSVPFTVKQPQQYQQHQQQHQETSPSPHSNIAFSSSTAPSASTTAITTASSSLPSNPRLPSPSYQPPYPSPSPVPAAASSTASSQVQKTVIRPRAHPRRPTATRSLWNPANSTPRVFSHSPRPAAAHQPSSVLDRERRTAIAIPLSHPDISLPKQGARAGGNYPLLTLPEQRHSRHSASSRASLQVERSGSSNEGSQRISLPRSVSVDLQRRRKSVDDTPLRKIDKGKGRAVGFDDPVHQITNYDGAFDYSAPSTPGLSIPVSSGNESAPFSTMPTDIERGLSSTAHPNRSTSSLPTGLGPALSTHSTSTSIIGSDAPPPSDPEWGPQHPCYPHLNPHVPLSSPLYRTTRVIRIRRDWMLEGDLAPTFSNLYPEILDPAGVSEQDFRKLIERVNKELVRAYSPLDVRNWLDGLVGLVTGWVSDDLGLTGVKGRLAKVERYLEEWNAEMEARLRRELSGDQAGGQGRKEVGMDGKAPRVVSLRRTGYMNIDIQIPDPEISHAVPEDNERDDPAEEAREERREEQRLEEK